MRRTLTYVKKLQREEARLRRLIIASLCWMVPLTWVVLTPPMTEHFAATSRTRQIIEDNHRLLRAFVEKYKSGPVNLGELRAFAFSQSTCRPDPRTLDGLRRMVIQLFKDSCHYSTYDAYGERLDYVRLDDRSYIIRSFLEDGLEASLRTPPDAGILYWPDRPKQGMLYKYKTHTVPDSFPAVLLLAADSPNRNWVARLFIDEETRRKHLVTRNKSHRNLFIMAPHDRVEEFLWLPDGNRLVYTATGSNRYRDGIFLWDLNSNQTMNLVDLAEASRTLSPLAHAKSLHLSLAGVSASGPTVHVFAYSSQTDVGLNPELFYSQESIVSFHLPLGGKETLLVDAARPRFQNHMLPLRQPLDLKSAVTGTAHGLPIQRSWMTLPTRGNMGTVLHSWQEFSEKTSHTPLFPYSLWNLASIYSESYNIMSAADEDGAEVLRTYGTEISKALLNYSLAPSYLSAMAHFVYKSLMMGHTLPFRVADLTMAPTVSLQHPDLKPSKLKEPKAP